MPVVIDKVTRVRVEDGRILSTPSREKDVSYLPCGKRESGESEEVVHLSTHLRRSR